MELDSPERLQWICPALVRTSDGLRCGVETAKVRPYWGRMLLFHLTALMVAGLSAGSGWFALLRHQGFKQVRWVDCVWPWGENQMPEARAAFFRAQAQAAFVEEDLQAAIVALSSGYASCSHCWQDGLLLAQLLEHVGQFARSDQVFVELAQRVPDHRDQILLAHHDAMLASRRIGSMTDLALTRLLVAPEKNRSWITPLLVGASVMKHRIDDRIPDWQGLPTDRATMVEVARSTPPLPPELRSKVQELRLSDPLLIRMRWRILLEKGERLAALNMAHRDREFLGPFEYALARWSTIDPQTSDQRTAEWWSNLIPDEPTEAQITRICAETILADRPVPLSLLRIRLPADSPNSIGALWITAKLQGDESLARSLLAELNMTDQDELTDWTFEDDPTLRELHPLAAVIPIPREVHYALVFKIARTSASPPTDPINLTTSN